MGSVLRDDDESSPDGYRYIAYLVRMWQEMPNSSWRASAQAVASGEIVHFASLEALYAYLSAQSKTSTYKPSVQKGRNYENKRPDRRNQ